MTSPQRKRRNNMKKSKLPAQPSKLRSGLRRESGALTHRAPKALRAKCVKRGSSFAKLSECARVLASLFGEAANLERDFHSIVGDPDFDMSLDGDGTESRRHFAFITGDNLRTAMRNDGFRHALFFTPCQLG